MKLLPWAITLRELGLSNTIAGLVLIHVVQGISFTTLFCRNYYVSIPQDLIKAARVDGAGFFRIFWRIVLPLSPPILIVTVIWQFTSIWNEFLFGVTFTVGRAAAGDGGADRAQRQHRTGARYTASRAPRCCWPPCRRCSSTSSAASISCAASPPGAVQVGTHGRARASRPAQALRRRPRCSRASTSQVERRRVRRAGRPVGLRQVHPAQRHRRPGERRARARSRSASATSPPSRPRTATSRWCSSPTRSIRR